METLKVTSGTKASWDIVIRDEDGLEVTTYVGTEALAASVWAGDAQAAAITPTVAWSTSGPPVVTLTVDDSQSDDLTARQTYTVRCTITDGGDVYEFFRGWIVTDPSPGTGTALDVYCTFADMLDLAGGLVDVLKESADQAGFAELRNKARQWTDRTCLARARSILEEQQGKHAAIVSSDPIEISGGVDDGPTWGRSIYPETSIRDQLDDVRALLNADDLILDPELIEANAAFALSLVYQRQAGGNEEYRRLAQEWRDRAIRTLAGYTFRFDTTTEPDGIAEREIEP
jgi:hypothetical protein